MILYDINPKPTQTVFLVCEMMLPFAAYPGSLKKGGAGDVRRLRLLILCLDGTA